MALFRELPLELEEGLQQEWQQEQGQRVQALGLLKWKGQQQEGQAQKHKREPEQQQRGREQEELEMPEDLHLLAPEPNKVTRKQETKLGEAKNEETMAQKIAEEVSPRETTTRTQTVTTEAMLAMLATLATPESILFQQSFLFCMLSFALLLVAVSSQLATRVSFLPS